MKKISYIIVGAQKAGTTSHIFHLNLNKDVYCYPNELHFFDNEDNFNINNECDITKYENNFLNANKKIIGEKTPIYMVKKICIDRIYKYYPDIKIIIILREPISRAFSQFKMGYRNKSVTNFCDEIELNLLSHEKKDKDKAFITSQCYHTTYLERGMYSEHIKNIYKYYKKENVYIGIAEEILNNPLEEYNKIYSFLGVDHIDKINFADNIHKDYNNNLEISNDYYFKLYDIYKKYNDELYELLGRKINLWENKYTEKNKFAEK
jgi:hypothetical protein